jgi:hypothetical protein
LSRGKEETLDEADNSVNNNISTSVGGGISGKRIRPYLVLWFMLKGPEPKCAIKRAAPSTEMFFSNIIRCVIAPLDH